MTGYPLRPEALPMNFFLGVSILVGIFGGLFALIVRESGWRVAFGTYGLTAALVALLWLAAWLISGG
jgi:hypothetical protein